MLSLLAAADALGADNLDMTEAYESIGWLSVLPTLVAFVLAAALRQVILALFAASGSALS